MGNYTKELDVAREAAADGAQTIRAYRENGNFNVSFKGRNDLVTDADVATEKKIIDSIQAYFPDDEILAEESRHKDALTDARTWVIDPIDGTTNFAHGFPIFCVSIGLWENRQPRVGLVLEVNSDECFHAIAGRGAFLNDEPIEVSDTEEAGQAMIGTGFPYNDLSLYKKYMQFFEQLLQQIQSARRPGAASYDLCCVAAGRFDGFYEYGLSPWDVGAASLIVREAGGVISDWEGGDDWLFGKRVVAGNARIHRFLLEAIGDFFTEEQRRL